MLKVKAEQFSIQGTGRVFNFKQGEIVADEIFVKEFPANGSGKIILAGLLKEKILEEVADKKKDEAKPKSEEPKSEKKGS